MDAMDMGGMDTPGMFTAENEYRARVLWYIIAASVGFMTCLRIGNWVQSRQRRTKSHHDVPSRPSGGIGQAIATGTAVLRELSYPQPIWFSGRISKYFTPPSLGRCLLLAAYWIVILTLLWSDVLLQPDDEMYPYRWEKVGFRAAWISVSQIPFIYLLSCKFNPISLLTGISYERFNWFHRWTARTVFLTVIVHWSYFFYEWYMAEFVDLELTMMPMVKYGFGAWAVIGWMIVSGFGFFRAASYEFFVVQHIFAAATLLWLLYVHVPAYATYNVWLSVSFVAFDWSARILLGFARNTHLLGKIWSRLPGYSARLEPLSDGMVRLTIDDVDFKWSAGQHVYISVPSLRPLELHPFTIATSSITGSLTMVIKAHSGFSRSVFKASQQDAASGRTRRVFISWPLGIPPDVSHYDTVILAACSTGASFVVPILQDVVANRGCVRRVKLHWVIRRREHQVWFSQALTNALEAANASGLRLDISIHLTERETFSSTSISDDSIGDNKTPMVRMNSNSIASVSTGSEREKTPFLEASETPSMTTSCVGRPSVEALIRPAVESAYGETAIVACGGLAFTAQIRTFVAALSDERAVHKGSGAQGIRLFTETYGW